jgi:hypothetical protein
LRDVKSSDVGLRRNSVYCTGILVYFGGAQTSGFHGAVAESIAPLTRSDVESDGGVRDNAVGALSRLLQVVDSSARESVSALLDVVLSALPLRNDLEEGPDVYHWLASTIAENPTSLDAGVVSRVVRAFSVVITEELAPVNTLRIIGIALSQGASKDERVRAAFAELSPDAQARVRAAGA